MLNDKDLIEQFQDHLAASKSGCKAQWKHIKDCRGFYSGDYMNYQTEWAWGRGSSRRVKEVSFNRVKPYVNSMVGFMAQMRRNPDYQAVIDDKEDQTAYTEYLNGFSDYVRENTHAKHHETRQDKDLLIGGIGVTDTAITTKMGQPTRLPHGEIIEERVDPLECGYDPSSVSANLLDSKWVYRAKDYYVEEAEELFNAEEDDFDVANQDDAMVYEFDPYGGIQDKIGYDWVDYKKKKVRVYFYQWYEVERFYRIENPLLKVSDPQIFNSLYQALSAIENEEDIFRFNPDDEILIVSKQNRKQVKDILEFFDIPFDAITDKRAVYYTAIISGTKVFQKYKSISQEGFTLKFKTGDYDDINKIWTGIVASMRDPQRYYNKSLTELMLIIANNARGGVIYEEDAVDNVAEFEASWARFNAATRVNSGALSGGKVQPKAQPHMNTGYEGILEVSGQNFGLVTGIDESFFGVISGGNETAMLQRQRIKQAMTTMACYFDAADLYLKEQARLMLSFMRLLAENSRGQMFRVFDPDGNVVFEQINSEFFVDEYMVSVGELPETPVQKEYYTQTLIGMAQSMQTIGDPRYVQMYAAAVKYMPIPERDKRNIIEILLGEQQMSQEQVQQIIEPLQQQIEMLQGQDAQILRARQVAETEKTVAQTQETMQKTAKTRVEIDETLEDVEKKSIENDIMASRDYSEVNVNI